MNRRNPGKPKPESPETCPQCGADVPQGARSCSECGSDHQTGWSEDAEADPLGLDQGEFDYDDFVERELGGPRTRPRGIAWYWWVTAVVMALLFLVWFFRL